MGIRFTSGRNHTFQGMFIQHVLTLIFIYLNQRKIILYHGDPKYIITYNKYKKYNTFYVFLMRKNLYMYMRRISTSVFVAFLDVLNVNVDDYIVMSFYIQFMFVEETGDRKSFLVKDETHEYDIC